MTEMKMNKEVRDLREKDSAGNSYTGCITLRWWDTQVVGRGSPSAAACRDSPGLWCAYPEEKKAMIQWQVWLSQTQTEWERDGSSRHWQSGANWVLVPPCAGARVFSSVIHWPKLWHRIRWSTCLEVNSKQTAKVWQINQKGVAEMYVFSPV